MEPLNLYQSAILIPILGILAGIIIPISVFIWLYFDAKNKQKTISIEDYIQPQSAYLYKWRILLHEIIGYYIYQLMGYI
mgnify:CR=1 FL=1